MPPDALLAEHSSSTRSVVDLDHLFDRRPLDRIGHASSARPTRHLPERILTAAHEACDLGALDVAGDLLRILEVVITGMQQTSPTAQRRSMDGLVAAHGRVWHLRHDRRLALDNPLAPLL